MKKVLFILTISAIILLTGCAANLPISSSINDFVYMGTKTNTKDFVTLSFKSNVLDGKIIPYKKDKAGSVGGVEYTHGESTILNNMINEYMSNKFSKLNAGSDIQIEVTLKDFWIEQYSTDSGGMQVLKALAETPANYMCTAKLKLEVHVKVNGEDKVKLITATSDNSNQGYSLDRAHAENINKVNNKAIMLMNAYFEEIGL